MKNFALVVFVFFFCLLSQSCHVKDVYAPESGAFHSPHYVQTYLQANHYSINPITNQSVFALKIDFGGEKIGNYDRTNEKVFDSLAACYADTSHTEWIVMGYNHHIALSSPLTSISIVADKDYDAGHKAGASLGDIVQFCGMSPFAFIQNGYVPTHSPATAYPALWTFMEFHTSRREYAPVKLMASEVNAENTHLLLPVCYLLFPQPPQTPGMYTFTLTIQWNNQMRSLQVTHTF